MRIRFEVPTARWGSDQEGHYAPLEDHPSPHPVPQIQNHRRGHDDQNSLLHLLLLLSCSLLLLLIIIAGMRIRFEAPTPRWGSDQEGHYLPLENHPSPHPVPQSQNPRWGHDDQTSLLQPPLLLLLLSLQEWGLEWRHPYWGSDQEDHSAPPEDHSSPCQVPKLLPDEVMTTKPHCYNFHNYCYYYHCRNED